MQLQCCLMGCALCLDEHKRVDIHSIGIEFARHVVQLCHGAKVGPGESGVEVWGELPLQRRMRGTTLLRLMGRQVTTSQGRSSSIQPMDHGHTRRAPGLPFKAS